VTFPIGLWIFGRFMPRKTQKGASEAAQWQAFKAYLTDIEKHANLEEAREQFETYLPYAIAFGIEKEWVKKFTKVNTPVPIWYDPFPRPIHTSGTGGRRGMGSPVATGGGAPSLDQAAGDAFSGLDRMSTGFFNMLDSASSTLVSAPSSSGSGGFSGGGFSGGGGGGGGSSGFG
jgi:uncharacterized membrane protein